MKMFILIIFIFYLISVTCWTFYGYVKAIDEYFCLEQRPGNLIYYNEYDRLVDLRFTYDGDNTTIIHQYGDLDLMARYYNGDGHELLHKFNNFNDYTELKINYTSGMTLSIKRYIENKFWVSDYDKLSYEFNLYNEPNYIKIFCLSSNETRNSSSSGLSLYVRDGKYPYLGNTNFGSKTNPSFLRCSININEMTCNIKHRGINTFVLSAFIMMGLFVFILCVSFFSDKVKMKLSDLLILLNLDNNDCLRFCNPLDNSSRSFLSGEQILKFTDTCDQNFKNLPFREICTSKNYDMSVNSKNNILIIDRKNEEVILNIEATDEKADDFRRFLFLLNISFKNWIVDDSNTHYINMETFIYEFFYNNSLNEIGLIKLNKNTYVNNSFNLFSNLLNRKYNLTKNLFSLLLIHNKNFFSEVRLTPLINVLKGESNWYSRPLNVKNVQWKRYVNDTNLIFGKFGYKVNFNHYKIFKKPTKVLEESFLELRSFLDKKMSIEEYLLPPINEVLNLDVKLVNKKLNIEEEFESKFFKTLSDHHIKVLNDEDKEAIFNFLKKSDLEEIEENVVKLEMEKKDNEEKLKLILEEEEKKKTPVPALSYSDCYSKLLKCKESLKDVKSKIENYRNRERRIPLSINPERSRMMLAKIDIESFLRDEENLLKSIEELENMSKEILLIRRESNVNPRYRKVLKFDPKNAKLKSSINEIDEKIIASKFILGKREVFNEVESKFKNSLDAIRSKCNTKKTVKPEHVLIPIIFKPINGDNNPLKSGTINKKEFSKIKGNIDSVNKTILNCKNIYNVLKDLNDDKVFNGELDTINLSCKGKKLEINAKSRRSTQIGFKKSFLKSDVSIESLLNDVEKNSERKPEFIDSNFKGATKKVKHEIRKTINYFGRKEVVNTFYENNKWSLNFSKRKMDFRRELMNFKAKKIEYSDSEDYKINSKFNSLLYECLKNYNHKFSIKIGKNQKNDEP